jgi:hypothetical protein
MLNKFFTPSEFDNNKGVIKICELAQRAEECARQAETAPSAVRDHYRQLEKYWLILAQHYLLTLEEAERSYGWAVHRSEPTQASSVFENERDEDRRH